MKTELDVLVVAWITGGAAGWLLAQLVGFLEKKAEARRTEEFKRRLKRFHGAGLFVLIGTLFSLLSPVNSQAQLTTTVTPGYVFSSGEVPTTTKLNQLGQPTILISGTINGTVGLSAKSVNGGHLTDSVVDNSTIDFTNTSPRALEVKAAGITKRELATNVAGVGLAGGAGTALFVVGRDIIDNSTLATNASGKIILATGLSGSIVTNTAGNGLAVTNGAISLTTVTLGPYTPPLSLTGTNLSASHGLGATPRIVRWIFRCGTNDGNYVVGDEIPVEAVTDVNANNAPGYSTGANSTTVFLTLGAVGGVQFADKNGGGPTTWDRTKWSAYCYAYK